MFCWVTPLVVMKHPAHSGVGLSRSSSRPVDRPRVSLKQFSDGYRARLGPNLDQLLLQPDQRLRLGVHVWLPKPHHIGGEHAVQRSNGESNYLAGAACPTSKTLPRVGTMDDHTYASRIVAFLANNLVRRRRQISGSRRAAVDGAMKWTAAKFGQTIGQAFSPAARIRASAIRSKCHQYNECRGTM